MSNIPSTLIDAKHGLMGRLSIFSSGTEFGLLTRTTLGIWSDVFTNWKKHICLQKSNGLKSRAQNSPLNYQTHDYAAQTNSIAWYVRRL